MTALIRFELQKVWRKGSFLSLMVLLLLLNIFLLWYLNQPTGDEPPLSAYKAVCQDISGMTEHEKLNFISDLKEQADGLSLVEQVQSLYGQGSEAGDSLAEQLKESNSDIYGKYEELYRTGDVYKRQQQSIGFSMRPVILFGNLIQHILCFHPFSGADKSLMVAHGNNPFTNGFPGEKL